MGGGWGEQAGLSAIQAIRKQVREQQQQQCAHTWASLTGSLSTGAASGVSMYHGATALTRMPRGAHSHARLRTSCTSGCGSSFGGETDARGCHGMRISVVVRG